MVCVRVMAAMCACMARHHATPIDIKKEIVMNTRGEKTSGQAIALIEAQLHTLPVSIAAVLEAFEVDAAEAALLEKLVLSRKPRQARTGSGGNIVAAAAQALPPLDFRALSQGLEAQPRGKLDHLRILAGNSLVVVGAFLHRHDMLSMRTPEVQFLGHVMQALLNGNLLRIAPGRMPTAAFDGLVIDAGVDGRPVFDTADQEGLMAIGDAIALLQWLSRYFRGEGGYVSGGDAG